MAAFLSATVWQQKLLAIRCISIFTGIPAVTLPSLILGTLSPLASASCQRGTPGKIIEDFWKITRGSRREDLICFYFLCRKELRCLQFASFLTYFCLSVSLCSSVGFHFTAFPFLMSLHFTHFLFPGSHSLKAMAVFKEMIFFLSVLIPWRTIPAWSNPFHKNGRATKNPHPFWCGAWVFRQDISMTAIIIFLLNKFSFLNCTPFTKAPSSKAANGCALGKPAINSCG